MTINTNTKNPALRTTVPNKSMKPVYCIDNGKRWTSAVECAEDLGVSASNVYMACNGVIKTCKKLHLRYEEDVAGVQEGMSDSLVRLSAANESMNTENDTLRAENDSLRAELKRLQAMEKTYNKHQKEVDERNAEIARLRKAMTRHKRAIDNYQKHMDAAVKHYNECAKQLEALEKGATPKSIAKWDKKQALLDEAAHIFEEE